MVILETEMFSLPLAKLSKAFWILFSSGLEGIIKEPRWESGEIRRLLITHILPGNDKQNLSQKVIFFLMLLRMVSKLRIHRAGSAEMSIPKIFVSVHRAKPRFLTWSGTGIILPICIIAGLIHVTA